MKRNIISLHFLPLFILTTSIHFLFAQNIIRHSISAHYEDGNSELDADGIENDVLVWKGGAVHVVDGPLSTSGKKLIIQAGAIVKFMGDPSGIGGGGNSSDPPALLEINGATLTFIEDSTAGGNTVSALEELGVTVRKGRTWHIGRFGAVGSHIRGSKLTKGFIVGIGNMDISNNEFFEWAGISAPFRRNDFYIENSNLNSEPKIISNRIIATTGPVIDTRGSSATILGNYIEAPVTSAIKIGYGKTTDNAASPTSGTTTIQNNTINGYGISMHGSNFQDYEALNAAQFNSFISNNILSNTSTRGSGMELDVYTNTLVTNNRISNYQTAIALKTIKDSPDTDKPIAPLEGFKINHNVFSSTNNIGMTFLGKISSFTDTTSLKGQLWKNGTYVNAEKNDWGHSTGPNDHYDDDGLFNDGAGLKVEDLIDYLPFVGQGNDVNIQGELIVTTDKSPPLFANTYVNFYPKVSYLLNNGVGHIELEVKTDAGDILVSPKPRVEIKAGTAIVDFESLQLDIPEDANSIILQAVLFGPAGPGVYTNSESFDVQFQTTQIRITEFKIETGLDGDLLIPGTQAKVKLKMEFVFSATPDQPGNITYSLIETSINRPKVIKKIYQTELVSVFSGGEPINREVTINVPLRSWISSETEIVVRAQLVTQSNRKVETESESILVDNNANNVKTPHFAFFEKTEQSVLRRNFLIPGEIGYYYRLWSNYTIVTPNQIGWIVEGEVLYYDYSQILIARNVMYQIDGSTALMADLSTGTGSSGVKTGVSNIRPVPTNAASVSFVFYLVTDSGIPVYREKLDFEVKSPKNVGSQSVSAGGESFSLSPLPITGHINGNRQSGIIKGFEFDKPFSSAKSPGNLSKSKTNFIPFNRYWELTTDLPTGEYSADLEFEYSPSDDFPTGIVINEDSLKIALFDTLAQSLVLIPTTVDPENNFLKINVTRINNVYVPVQVEESIVNVDIQPSIQLVGDFVLYQNYPNPFNPLTTIEYSLSKNSHIKLVIYDLLGQRVRFLEDSRQLAGNYKIIWEGLDNKGRQVPSGLYFCHMEAEDLVGVIKLALVR